MTTPLAEGDPLHIGSITLEARIGEGGSTALAKLPTTAKLAALDVRRNQLSEKAIRTLKARFGKGVTVE